MPQAVLDTEMSDRSPLLAIPQAWEKFGYPDPVSKALTNLLCHWPKVHDISYPGFLTAGHPLLRNMEAVLKLFRGHLDENLAYQTTSQIHTCVIKKSHLQR